MSNLFKCLYVFFVKYVAKISEGKKFYINLLLFLFYLLVILPLL